MILDKVDFSHIASAFKLRDYTYSGCNPASLSMPVGHNVQNLMLQLEKEISSSAQNSDVEQKQNKQDSSWPRKKHEHVSGSLKTNDEWMTSTSELQKDLPISQRGTQQRRDCRKDRLQVESQSQMVQSTPESQKHKLRKLERLTIRTTCANAARPTVSRHPNKNTRIVHKFSNECTAFRYFSLEAAFERLVVTAGSKKNPRLVD
ncbi:hypothetical protein M436DRAFT_65666 [Aureobasidium namibiae CBS 147.97]|uniref:Uncharacterized protein n=1 Tax=Aureobasidium namibiae CBS 147.97 TaxID=1043004 RepID=A0A074XA93_9PEZI|nr:uncharacterized protein M436DRAFT_65666 [Aureobasidium namibiae CBS 147.97]KEQ71551.1 hypothetical protein M436DRAFT_65666 [Aureobasidium namibiae CBS 147.97]